MFTLPQSRQGVTIKGDKMKSQIISIQTRAWFRVSDLDVKLFSY